MQPMQTRVWDGVIAPCNPPKFTLSCYKQKSGGCPLSGKNYNDRASDILAQIKRGDKRRTQESYISPTDSAAGLLEFQRSLTYFFMALHTGRIHDPSEIEIECQVPIRDGAVSLVTIGALD